MRTPRFLAEVSLLTFLVLVFVFALLETRNLSSDGRLFPLFVTVVGLPVIVAALTQTLRRARKGVPAAMARSEVGTDSVATAVAPTADVGTDEAQSDGDREVAALDEQAALAHGHQIEATRSQNIRFWVWFLSFCGGLWLFGFYVGLPVVAGLFVLLDARKSWWKALATTVVVWLCIYALFTEALGIRTSGVFL